MIIRWNIKNFKSIKKLEAPLTLAPLTLICGANSSGKSTIIQSILMVSQTLGSPATDRPLVLNGELVKLGFPVDILHKGGKSEEIEFGFELGSLTDVARSANIKADVVLQKAPDNHAFSSRMAIISSTICTANQELKIMPEMEGAKLSRLLRQNNLDIPIVLKQEIEMGTYDYRLDILPNGKERERRQLYGSVDHFLPAQALGFESLDEYVRRAINEAARALAGKPQSLQYALDFKSPLGRRVKKIIGSILKKSENKSGLRGDLSIQELARVSNLLDAAQDMELWVTTTQKHISTRVRNLISNEMSYFASKESIDIDKGDSLNSRNLIQETLDPEIHIGLLDIINTFTKFLHYLGPLRDDPKMISGLPPLPDSREVGLKGEYTAAVLERFGNQQVNCPIPPNGDQYEFSIRSMKLVEAVSLWLGHMGLVRDFRTKDQGKMGVELSLLIDGLEQEVDLTNVGVGVSQVLPLLTLCLLADKKSVILIEQPELHLHPKVQMMLGDFLLGISYSGKQCIIETHSDRLINRVRRRIAESIDQTIMDLTQIYFVERESSATKIISVEPNEFGAIPDWPKGFFDEVIDETQKIIDAATRKRETKLRNILKTKKGNVQ